MTDLERYSEVLVEVDGWQLLRKTVEDEDETGRDNHYKSMMWHECPDSPAYDIRNGSGKQSCYGCNVHIPDEVWALWILHNGGI